MSRTSERLLDVSRFVDASFAECDVSTHLLVSGLRTHPTLHATSHPSFGETIRAKKIKSGRESSERGERERGREEEREKVR